MLPICYPSSPSPTTGLPEAVAYALSSVTGLTRWVDYIPVKLVGSPLGMNEQTTNLNGFAPMRLIGSAIGMAAWSDYIPVYVDNSATEAWVTSATGYIPYANSVSGATALSFYLNLSNPSGATITTGVGTVTINNFAAVAITNAITPSRVSGVAPLSVFFDATGTTAVSATSKPFHHLGYSWDFGDAAGGATWTVGARAGSSKNTAFGGVASHVFETPGTYTVTLVNTFYPIGRGMSTAYRTVTVVVDDPETVFASNTICFSDTADFTGAPVGATQVTTTDFAGAFNTYKTTKKRLLFKRGGVYNTSTANVIIDVPGPGIIGAYGTGAAPIFRSTGTSFFQLSSATTPGISDWRVMDLECDGQSGSIAGVGGSGGIDKVLFLRVNMHDVNTGYNLSEDQLNYWNNHANSAYHGHTLWDQFAIVDCQVQRVTAGVPTSGKIGLYLSATRHTLMGSTFDVETGGEHCVRYPYISRGVVQNNYMLRPAPSKHALTVRGANAATVGALVGQGMQTELMVISENTFYSDQSSWVTTTAPQNTSVDERISDIIWERNYFRCSNADYAMMSRGCVKRLTVRNNIVNLSGASATSGAFAANGSNAVGAPQSEEYEAYCNTVYRSDAATSLIGNNVGSNAINYAIANSLIYAPNVTTVTPVAGSIDSGLVVGVNSTGLQARTVSPSFTSTPLSTANQLSATDFVPSSEGYAKDAGGYVPVFFDFARATRAGKFDLGAHNL